MSELNNKVAIVTGASKGIGAGIAKHLAAAGAAVAVNYSSSREGADKVVAEITAKGGKAFAVHGDVANKADVKKMVEATIASFGPLDILVNNAGVYNLQPLEAVTEAEFLREFNINVLSKILCTQEAVKHFGANDGRVINITSIAGVSAFPNSVVYAATNAAIDSLTRVLAAELGPTKIRVNAIGAGVTISEGFEAVAEHAKNFVAYSLAQTPLGRVGYPDDIAKLAVFLASDNAAWITGERIAATGGLR